MRVNYQVRDQGNCDVVDGIEQLESAAFQAQLASWFAQGYTVEMFTAELHAMDGEDHAR